MSPSNQRPQREPGTAPGVEAGPRPSEQRRRARSLRSRLAWGLLLLLLALAGWLWWTGRAAPPLEPAGPQSLESAGLQPVTRSEPASGPLEPPPAAPAVSSAEPEAAEPLHPLEPVGPALPAAGLAEQVIVWLGREPSLRFLALDDLARRSVATIDNLPRGHAAPALWPLLPVGGRMAVSNSPMGQLQIAPGNPARYDAVVDWVTSLEPVQVASWYRQAYPLLQQAYEELGYPRRHFNDRLVQVIDHLLQTPRSAEPLALRLVQVQGDVAVQAPWLRYEYADARLQALSAGQKLLLRLGTVHGQRIRDYLIALRAQIA